MCKRAEIPILTLSQVFRVKRAEFCLVFVWFVKLFDSVMRFLARVAIWADDFVFVSTFAEFDWPEISCSFSVLLVVIEFAMFVVVLVHNLALLTLEMHQFQMVNKRVYILLLLLKLLLLNIGSKGEILFMWSVVHNRLLLRYHLLLLLGLKVEKVCCVCGHYVSALLIL